MAGNKILITEDSYIVSLHLQTTLESEGYEIIGVCTSGEEVLDFLKDNVPDLILMDIMLDGEMDGVEAASRIRDKYMIPVIYISALSDKDTIQRAKLTEPYGFLTKPFEDREIFTVIEITLYKHSIEMKLKAMEEERDNLLRQMEIQKVEALIKGQENERSRIAKDLHDGLGQLLNAVKINYNSVIEHQADSSLLYSLIDDAIQECVRISENLMPARLQDFDLASCLRSLCKQIDSKTGTRVTYIGGDAKIITTQEQKINLYRITQEAINNSIKHSKASSIQVNLTEWGNRLSLSVTDDGNSLQIIDNIDLYRQNGLTNMRDRAQIMGGRFSIEHENGTIVNVEIPVNKDRSHV